MHVKKLPAPGYYQIRQLYFPILHVFMTNCRQKPVPGMQFENMTMRKMKPPHMLTRSLQGFQVLGFI